MSPVERAGAALGALAVSLALGIGLRGINAPFPDGHFASVAAIGVFADNMWRWKTLFPVMGYMASAPSSASFYMHHPPGMFWTAALLGKLFGFHNWVLRLPALVCVTLTPYLLYRIGRALWGPIEGGLAALAFVSLPITLGYANYHDLEQPVMLGCTLGTWGYLRFAQTWKERYALASLGGFLLAASYDWQGYLWGGFLLAGLLVRGYLLPERWLGPVAARPFGRYWALLCVAAVASLGFELYLVNDSGRVGDLMSIYGVRTAGSAMPLAAQLTARAYRIELMFTGLGILLGKLAVPVILVRAVVKRSDLELLPIPMLLTAIVQYVVFKQGADVHIFWPHPFAMYFGLAIGALAASVKDTLAWAGARSSASRVGWLRRLAPHAAWAGLAVIGLPLLFVLRDGLSIVRLSRETGGRFAEANLESFLDEADALRWFLDTARVPPTAPVAFHPSVLATWALKWEVRPRPSLSNQSAAAPLPPDVRVFLLDSRNTSLADLRAAAARYQVHVVGPYWLVDPRQAPGPLSGYAFDEHEPSWLERWSLGSTEPVRTVRADPWVTWEWRTLLGQPADPPTGAPSTADQLRIAHNVAVARGDLAAAASLRTALVGRFNLPLAARYEGGTELLGAIHHRGAQRSITFFFVAGVFKSDLKFSVDAKVVTAPVLSTLPMDPAELDLAMPPRWPTSLWRAGQIYSIKVVYRRRPGHERFRGRWSGGLRRLDAAGPLEIGRL